MVAVILLLVSVTANEAGDLSAASCRKCVCVLGWGVGGLSGDSALIQLTRNWINANCGAVHFQQPTQFSANFYLSVRSL